MTNHGHHAKINYGSVTVFAGSRLQIPCAFLAMMLLIGWPAVAQSDAPQVEIMPATWAAAQSAPQEQQVQEPQSQQPPAGETEITIPAGTRLSLALFRSISFKHTKSGDPVHLQVVFPVTVGNRMAIPPGTYVQGVVDAIKRGNRRYEVLAMRLRWADIIFATGYTVSISGPLDLDPTYGALSRPASPRSKQVPVMADTGPPQLPPLPPLPSIGPSPAVITGIVFGSLAAVTVAGVIWYHNRDFLMEAGTPVEIILTSPLVLDESSVTAAVQQFSAAPPEIVSPPRRMRTCWTTGTPDYPSTPYPCPY